MAEDEEEMLKDQNKKTGRIPADGGWRMADGGWRMADGG
jgi:hypothetical protein